MHKIGIIGIFVLFTIENERETFINDIIFNSVCTLQSQNCIRINLDGNCVEIIYIRSYTEMPILPTSGISKKLDYMTFSCLIYNLKWPSLFTSFVAFVGTRFVFKIEQEIQKQLANFLSVTDLIHVSRSAQ